MKARFMYVVPFWIALLASVGIVTMTVVSMETNSSRTLSVYWLGWLTFSMCAACVLSPFSFRGNIPIIVVGCITVSMYTWFKLPHGFQVWAIPIGAVSSVLLIWIRKGIVWIKMLNDYNKVWKEEVLEEQLIA